LRIDSRIRLKPQAQVRHQILTENNSEKNFSPSRNKTPANKTYASVRLREIKIPPFKLRCVAEKADLMPRIAQRIQPLNERVGNHRVHYPSQESQPSRLGLGTDPGHLLQVYP
jgi:hypothetical protein